MKLDPEAISVLKILDEYFRKRGLQYVLIGAQVPKILISSPVLDDHRPTLDVDITFKLENWSDFNKLKQDLHDLEFTEDRFELRFKHGTILFDFLPYISNEVKDGFLILPQSDRQLNLHGFERLFKHQLFEEIETGFRVPVVPLQIFVYTKILAFLDRGISQNVTKDLEDIIFVLQNYETEDLSLRRFDTDIPQKINFENRGAYLLGIDLKQYLKENEQNFVEKFSKHFKDKYSPYIQKIAGFESNRSEEILVLFESFFRGLEI